MRKDRTRESNRVEVAGMDEGDDHVLPEGKVLPLNWKRLVAAYIKAIAESMELPSKASTDEVRQLIEGKLLENGREPRNVQVIVQEPTEEGMGDRVCLFLVDDSGIISRATLEPRVRSDLETESVDTASESLHKEVSEMALQLWQREEEIETLMTELEVAQRIAKEAEEKVAAIESYEGEIEKLTKQLQRERERYKQVWRMNCEQLAEHDVIIAEKDAEIVALQEQLRLAETLPHRPTAPSTGADPGRGVRPVCTLTGTSVESGGVCGEYRETEGGPSRVRRYRGKAPPVDPFTGEDPEVRLDDWLPALTRASRWNEWTPDEALMQLAGYLRGRALQEWGLLQEEEKSN